MIKFFRKIRQQLLSQNRFRKYILYAVGEIVLVVIGILIALQVNNSNINRINRNTEQQVLVELKEEYESNLAQLQEKVDIRAHLIMSSAAWLIDGINERNKILIKDSVDFHLSKTLIVPTYDPVVSVTEELINSGKLQLISNMALRTKLTKWPSRTNDQVREEEQFVTFMYEYYMMFLIEQYELKPLVRNLQNDETIYNLLKMERSDFNLSGEDKQEDVLKLFNNQDFEDYLSAIMGFCNFLNNSSQSLIEENKSILKLINTEIKT